MPLFLLLLGMTLPPPVILLDRDLNAAACLYPGGPSDDKALVLSSGVGGLMLYVYIFC